MRKGIFNVTVPKAMAVQVAAVIRAVAKDLEKDNIPPGPGGFYKARLNAESVESLTSALTLEGRGLYVDDHPARIHPDWLEDDERFVCTLANVLVVRVVR
jgi:hypothetical protein